jgi:Rrf2 family iron-sulfur cluster assembly transcriptional regulator
MKINALDEYGLRIMIRIAKANQTEGLSIPQLSELEGLSNPYVAKITRSLREGELLKSNRGHKGGYILAKAPELISVNEILKKLGGKLYDTSFCDGHSGELRFCTNSVDCSVRSMWRILQTVVDQVLEQITLADLMQSEDNSFNRFQLIAQEIMQAQKSKAIATN